jgi:hypothetical protein
MAYPALFALTMLVATALPPPTPGLPPGAPPAPPSARYCLRVDPATGSNIETIRCETRDVWASMDVDVDREWSMWGVRVLT